jgi:hypothetical protein
MLKIDRGFGHATNVAIGEVMFRRWFINVTNDRQPGR